MQDQPEIPGITLPGPVGSWLGEMESHALSIALIGETHAGKTQLAAMLVNAFLEKGWVGAWYDLEQKGLKSRATRGTITRQISEKNLNSGKINMWEDPIDIATFRQHLDSGQFKWVYVDSYPNLGVNADEFEQLRVDYPHIIFVFIFQLRDDGKTRGGNQPDYNAPVAIHVLRDPEKIDFKKNYARLLKNRENNETMRYGFRLWDQKILQVEELARLAEGKKKEGDESK